MYSDKYSKRKIIGGVTTLILSILIPVLLLMCTVKVPAGYVAVQYSMNGGVKDDVLYQGWHIVSPTTHATKYSVGIEQSYLTADRKGDSDDDESFEASSSEGKAITVDLTFTYQFDVDRVHTVFTEFKGRSGTEVRDTFIKPNIVSWSKEVIARYPVSSLLGAERASINLELTDYLAKKFDIYGIKISNVSLINLSVDAETTNAINAKINAQEAQKKAAIENQTKLEAAENEVQVAEMKAKASLIEAEAQAEANKVLQQSLTEGVLEQQWIEKWDGQLPTYMTGSSDVMIGIGGADK